jgi:hypothetical protein
LVYGDFQQDMDESADVIIPIGFFEVEGFGDGAVDVVGFHVAGACGIEVGAEVVIWGSFFACALVLFRDLDLEGLRYGVGGEWAYYSGRAGLSGRGGRWGAWLRDSFRELGGGFGLGRGGWLSRGWLGLRGLCHGGLFGGFRFCLTRKGWGRWDGLDSGLLTLRRRGLRLLFFCGGRHRSFWGLSGFGRLRSFGFLRRRRRYGCTRSRNGFIHIVTLRPLTFQAKPKLIVHCARTLKTLGFPSEGAKDINYGLLIAIVTARHGAHTFQIPFRRDA